MKKTIFILLSLFMLLSLALTGCATEQTETQVSETTEILLQIGNPNMTVNGTEKPIDAEGTVPVLLNDRTLLPVRAVVEEMGGTVGWDDAAQAVTLHYATDEIRLVIDDTTASLNGTPQTLDTAPAIRNDRTMLPIRFIAESFHFEVVWNEAEQKVTITKSTVSDENNPIAVKDNLVLINGGTFQMGSPANEPERGKDETQHEATVDSFYMAKTELTQKEYQSVMGKNPSENQDENLPVTNITWYDAIQYCNELSKSEGLTPCYTISGNTIAWDKGANGYRLPTEAEWVWDWYSEYSTNAAVNPTGAENGSYKIARGGGWNDFPKHIRSAYRSAFPADVPFYSIGMRLVRSAAPSAGEVKSVYHAEPKHTTGKVLIAYFSQTGNTDGFAKIIQEISGADSFRIERAVPYSATHNSQGLYAEALKEQREDAAPELKQYLSDAALNMEEYDTILLGYCNWWASIPAPVQAFLMHYDLSGKTIIPFCSMGGGRFGQTISAIAKLAPDSVIKEGLDVTYSSYDRNKIGQWLEESNINTKK